MSTELLAHTEIGRAGLSQPFEAIGSEVKILLHGALETGVPTPTVDVHRRVMIEANGAEFTPHLKTPFWGVVASRLPKGDVELTRATTEHGQLLTKTQTGEKFTALGGMVLEPLLGVGYAVKKIVNEPRRYTVNGEVDSVTNSIDARLVVLTVLQDIAACKPQGTTRLLDQCEEGGVNRNVLYFQLRALVKNGLVVRGPKVKKGRNQEDTFRIAPTYGVMKPLEVIRGFLKTAADFASSDEKAMDKGFDFMGRVLKDTSTVPYLVKRSLSNAKRSRTPERDRSPKPATSIARVYQTHGYARKYV